MAKFLFCSAGGSSKGQFLNYANFLLEKVACTGKSLSEALLLAPTTGPENLGVS